MNGLSWLIYGMQIVDGVSNVISGVIVATLFAAFVLGFIALMARGIESISWPLDLWVKHARWVLPLLVAISLLNVLIPSRQTMLLIAGSEIGGRAINTPSVREVVDPGMDLLKTWIAKETKKLKAEDK